MLTNEYTDNQKEIFQNLLRETLREYVECPENAVCGIRIGASETVFSFRNFGPGLLPGVIARAVLPIEDGLQPSEPLSAGYSFESYFSHDAFELYSFHERERVLLVYKKGKRELFVVSPDPGPNGLLVRIEWEHKLNREEVLTEEDVRAGLRQLFWGRKNNPQGLRMPETWLNGVRLEF